jgi:hypothetical protein
MSNTYADRRRYWEEVDEKREDLHRFRLLLESAENLVLAGHYPQRMLIELEALGLEIKLAPSSLARLAAVINYAEGRSPEATRREPMPIQHGVVA